MHQRVEQAIGATFPELRDPAPGRGTNEPGAEGEEGRPSLKSIVERGIESAVKFDIQDGPDIAAFIALGLSLRLAPAGEAGSWIPDYLNRTGTDGATRLHIIESQLRSLGEDEPALMLVAERVAQARDAAAL